MELQSFQGLEDRINKALQRIDELKQENQRIFSSADLLSQKISEFEEKSKFLEQENYKLKEQISKVDIKFKSKEQELKQKIENLIQKLSLLETIN